MNNRSKAQLGDKSEALRLPGIFLRRLAQEARDFIRKTLQHGHAPTARDIAFHLNVSIRKIENDFSSIYRHTLRDEIAAQRLDLLCHALRTSNEPIKTLVARSGFGDMSQATRVFKAKFGLTMNQFRNSRFPETRQQRQGADEVKEKVLQPQLQNPWMWPVS